MNTIVVSCSLEVLYIYEKEIQITVTENGWRLEICEFERKVITCIVSRQRNIKTSSAWAIILRICKMQVFS